MKPFIPHKLPLRSLHVNNFSDLLIKAHETLARFDELSCCFPNPLQNLSILALQETFHSLSSQNMDLSFEEHYLSSSSKIRGFIKAIEFGERKIRKHSLSLPFILKLHVFVEEGSEKWKEEIGKLRKKQNWIGREQSPIEKAYYLPPPPNKVKSLLQNFQQYLKFKEKDVLLQLAIVFAHFLNIHPFMDGNGRVARLLIPLFLYRKKVISYPLFFMSRYFQNDRDLYFKKLFLITDKNDWEGWIHYFLMGIIDEGDRVLNQMRKMFSLFYLRGIDERSRSYLFKHPIFNQKDFLDLFSSKKQGLSTLRHLKKEKLITSYSSNKELFIFTPLMNIVKSAH